MKYYISGPIRNNPNYKDEFEAAASWVLWNTDDDFWNPVWLEAEVDDPTQEWYMRRSIEELLKCDAILMLDGWEDSEGAKVEKAVAHALGLRIFYWDKAHQSATESSPPKITAADFGPSVEEAIDAEARRVVYGDRGKVYGPATGDFERTGKMWAPILGLNEPVSPERVAACMIALKMSRLHNTPEHRDSMVDIIGYTLCMKDIMDEKGQ